MATTTMGVPDPAPEQPVNHIGRIFGVFFSPGATYAEIAKRPTWLVPVIVLSLLGAVVAFSMNKRVDWRDVASKRIESSPRASRLTPEQKEQQLDVSAKISPGIAYFFGVCGPILYVVIVGGVMLLAYNLLGGANANFKVSMGIVAHAACPGILSSLLLILVIFLRPYGTLNLDNPLAANLGAFLPDDASKWLVSLAGSFDLFSFWTLILIGIGFAAFNPRKLKTGGSIGIAVAVWAAFVVVKVGLTFVFS